MAVRVSAVRGLRSAADEALAVVAGDLFFSAGLVEEHLEQSRISSAAESLHSVAGTLLAAAGCDLSHVGKLKATLSSMRAAEPVRKQLESAFGETALLTLVGGEACRTQAGAQVELLAAQTSVAQRLGNAVRLGPLAFAEAHHDGGDGAGDLSLQAEHALTALLASLVAAGAEVDDIVKVNNTAACWHNYGLYNAVYDRLLSGSQSARCSVGGAGEHPLALVTVEAIAALIPEKQFVDSATSGVGRTSFMPDPRTIYRTDIGPCKGPHTHGARAGDLIFIAGECPYDANDRLVGPGDIAEQTRKTIENVAIGLETLGSSLADVVKVNVTLSDARLMAGFDDAYRRAFGEIRAARSLVATPLGQYGILVEIEAIAVRGSADNRLVLTGADHG